MASARFAWGIDIGNRALKAIRLSRGDSGLKIDDFEVIEHENVLSNTGDNKESLIQSALASFVQRHQTKGGAVAISVSGVSSFARFIKLPPVESRKIPEIVRFEAIQQIPFPLADVEWAYQLFHAADSPEVEVGIFAMRRELIDRHIKAFTDVNLNVQYVQMNPLAVYNAMYYDGRLKGTTMIIDLGAETTDLIIADGESIWLRSIPIGGNNFTEVLVKSFKLPFAKAEDLKRNAATSKYARQIFQALRPVFADLVAEIQRSIGFYSSVHRDSRIKKIISLGGTFRLPGLQKYLQQNLQLEVERMDRLSAGAPPDGKLAATFNENLLSLVSAYGLAIQAMGEGKITSSLLPQYIRREKMWRDKTKWFAAAAACFVLGTAAAGGGYYLQQLQYNHAQTTRDSNSQVLIDATNLDNQWKRDVQDAGAQDRMAIGNLRSLLLQRNLWPKLVADIFATLPKLPPGALGGTPQEIAGLKKTPRGQRDMILITRFQSEFCDNLAQKMAAIPELADNPAASGAAGRGEAAKPSVPPGSRGFIITLGLLTPHDPAYLYIFNGLCAKLAALNDAATAKYNQEHSQDPKSYYIAKVSGPLNGTYLQLKDEPAKQLEIRKSDMNAQILLGKIPTDTGGAAPVLPPSAPIYSPEGAGTAGTPPIPELLDRITGEDRKFDWEAQIKLVVVIKEPPKGP